MNKSARGPWLAVGVAAGWLGIALDYLLVVVLGGQWAVAAVAEWIIRFTPGPVAESVIQRVGHADKPLLGAVVLLVLTGVFAWVGVLAERRMMLAELILTGVTAIGLVAVLTRPAHEIVSVLDLFAGYAASIAALVWLSSRARFPVGIAAPAVSGVNRRQMLIGAGAVAAGSLVVAGAGRVLGRGARAVEAARSRLFIPGMTQPQVPAGAMVDASGVAPWQTAALDFYQVDTAFGPPQITPADWRLRIHGMVDKEIVLTWDELLKRPLVEAWITLNCVSNSIGGDLIGNAWWSGFRIADLLAEAGVHPDADAIKQTSHDGWTCGTPIGAVTDQRDAMLAVGMNGAPLPVNHGFPVRMIVPGFYGFVSATKWITDIEVTQFSKFTAYWTDKGWSEQAPVKLASRIDTPRSSSTKPAGPVRFGGEAWQQHTGIKGVQLQVDGGPWTDCQLGRVPSSDCWVQWTATVEIPKGQHQVKVRAISATGEVQTPVYAEPAPNGASGLHTIRLTTT